MPRLWDFAFGLGSLVAALCQGFALGGLIGGPTVANGRFAGGPFDWFSPFSVLVALGVVFGYVLLGATYLIIKTEGSQQEHSVRMAWVGGALMLRRRRCLGNGAAGDGACGHHCCASDERETFASVHEERILRGASQLLI